MRSSRLRLQEGSERQNHKLYSFTGISTRGPRWGGGRADDLGPEGPRFNP